MLQKWIQQQVITADPFECFLKTQQCITLASDRNVSDIDLDILVDKVISNSASATGLFYLNVCHWIFKAGRQNIGDNSHPVYSLIGCFSRRSDAIQGWISKQVTNTDEQYIVPFLVWVIDVLKLSNLTDEGMYLIDILSLETWISHIINFWRHSHITVVRRSLELVHRWMIKQREHHNDMEIIIKLLEYIHLCKRTLSRPQLALLQEHDRTDFFYQPIWDPSSPCALTLDRECLNWLIQITVVSVSNMLHHHQSDDESQLLTSQLDSILQQTMVLFEDSLSSSRSLLDFIWNICGSNDQVMIQLQLDILNIYLGLEQQQHNDRKSSALVLSHTLSPLLSRINPHTLFIYFLERTGMDYELVVDLLMSDETDMLLFLTRYLKYVEQHAEAFIQAADQVLVVTAEASDNEEEDDGEETGGIHSIIGLLYQVWTVLQSDLFPYNASVLARRISAVLECLKLVVVY